MKDEEPWPPGSKSRRREATRYLPLHILLPNLRCGLFDQSCNLFRSGNVDGVTGSGDFDLMAVGSRGIPAFEVGVDGSICCGYQRPARLASPGGRGDDCFEIVSEVEHLGLSHKSGLLRRQVSCEVHVKLRWIEVRETVGGLLYRTRLAEITWEALSVISFVLSSIGHVGRDVHQTSDG